MDEPLAFFATQSRFTDPGEHAALLDGLPREIEALCGVVQGLMLHVFWAERNGVTLDAARREEVNLRWVARQLARLIALDGRPLDEAREPERHLVGNCRDFSVLLTAILRHQGVPARARCGFGRYFMLNHYEDHWVCEYWSAEQARWVLVDAQLDALQRRVLAIPFDPLDVPRDQFTVGGEGWRLCRAGLADPETFGIQDMHGLWFVRGDMLRDVAALNKVEMLPWDTWGLVAGRDADLSPDDLALLDRAAELTRADVPDWPAVRRLYEADPRLRVPRSVRSYAAGGEVVVEVG
jgi:hypothetical protein